MAKLPKKSSTPKSSAPRQNWLPLLVAGAVGFFAAFVLLKGCPLTMLSCPVYSNICPVTATLGKIEKALDRNDLPAAHTSAEKLQDLLASRMPDLSQAARKIAESQNLDQARRSLAEFKWKMEKTSYQPAPSSS